MVMCEKTNWDYVTMRATSHQISLQSNKLVHFTCLPFKIAFQQCHRTNWNKILAASIVSGLKPASRGSGGQCGRKIHEDTIPHLKQGGKVNINNAKFI